MMAELFRCSTCWIELPIDEFKIFGDGKISKMCADCLAAKRARHELKLGEARAIHKAIRRERIENTRLEYASIYTASRPTYYAEQPSCGEWQKNPICSHKCQIRLCRTCSPSRYFRQLAVNQVNRAIMEKSTIRLTKKIRHVGCDAHTLLTYIENQFDENINWLTRNKWRIDFRVPIGEGNPSESEMARRLHYTNIVLRWGRISCDKNDRENRVSQSVAPLEHTQTELHSVSGEALMSDGETAPNELPNTPITPVQAGSPPGSKRPFLTIDVPPMDTTELLSTIVEPLSPLFVWDSDWTE